jgi:hypothetical protein
MVLKRRSKIDLTVAEYSTLVTEGLKRRRMKRSRRGDIWIWDMGLAPKG